jgi:predicted transcriptional regulator
VERALLSLVTLTDEMARQDLPPPEACFRLVKATGSLPCQDLLGQAGELLARGASVEEIARELGLPWTYVASCLRRLQAAGAVRPTLTMGR